MLRINFCPGNTSTWNYSKRVKCYKATIFFSLTLPVGKTTPCRELRESRRNLLLSPAVKSCAVAILRNRTLIYTFKFENYAKATCIQQKTPAGALRVTRCTRVCKATRREGGILMSARAESSAAPENVAFFTEIRTRKWSWICRFNRFDKRLFFFTNTRRNICEEICHYCSCKSHDIFRYFFLILTMS